MNESSNERKTGLPVIASSSDLIPKSNRIVVFGSRLSGAFTLADEFQQFLRGANISNVIVEPHRNAPYFRQAFYGLEYGPTLDSTDKTLPAGVIVFPEMRQYDERSGAGMSLHTYSATTWDGTTLFENIKSLCEKHAIPLLRFEYLISENELRENIVRLLNSSNQTPKE